MKFLRRTLAVAAKDLRSEIRSKEAVNASVSFALVILLLFSWVSLVHVVRAEFLRARNFEYVNAARALGLRVAVGV